MRPDLLPVEVVQPLEALFDRVPPEPLELTIQSINEELGLEPSQIFLEFFEEPIAAGSFATVYKARLKTGELAAVKVQRRDVDRIVRKDLSLLFFFARFVDLTGFLKRFRLSRFVTEFAEWTQEELDYEREARNIEYINRKKLSDSVVAVPRVYWKFSTRRVLTLEFLQGIWLTDAEALDQLSQDARTEYARQIFASFMHDILEVGFFHADPHPGNMCILPGGRIGLIDFGIVGYVSDTTSRAQSELLWAIQRNDSGAAFEAVQQVLNVPPDADLEKFRRSFESNVRHWHMLQYQPDLPAAVRSGGRLLLANFKAAREAGLSFKSTAARYYRAFILVDAIVTRLDDSFDQQAAMSEYFRRRYMRSRLRKGVSLMSGISLQMAALARVERMATALDQILHTRAEGLITSVIDETFLRFSNIAKAGSYFFGFSLIIYLIFVLLSKLSPELIYVGDTTSVIWRWLVMLLSSMNIGLVAASLAFCAVVSAWASRLLWINAYRGERYAPLYLEPIAPRRRPRSRL
ncbi:hypothetical protein GOD60_29815 [Sinorhizobium medicae]|nr:hypothetical protein [Sinorhizobium medicae]